MITTDPTSISEAYRKVLTQRCGGEAFDAPGGGYSFSNVLAEERHLMTFNVEGNPSSALCKLSIADPTWKMPRPAMMAALSYYEDSPNATRYTDNNGIPGTHEGIADFLNRVHPGGGVTFDPAWVQYSPGSIKRLLAEYIPAALFENGVQLFFPTPGYGVIKDPINRHGAQVHDIPLVFVDGRWTLDLERIPKVEGAKKVLYLNMPHNPTGASFSRKDWESLIEWAIAHKVVVIVDEAYTHLRFDDSVSVLDVPDWEQCCIVLQSVSKGWNATGLRFGWVVAHPTIVKVLRKVMDVKDSGAFGPSVAAGLWCLQNTQYAEVTRAQYQGLHEALYAGLREAGFDTAMPSAGLCQFTPAPRGAGGVRFASAQECAQWFRKELRISLMHYTVNNDPWLRWAVTIAPVVDCGLKDETAVINETVRRLREAKLQF